MDFFKALFQHIYLLLTFRHDGNGIVTAKDFFKILLFVHMVIIYLSTISSESFNYIHFLIFGFIIVAMYSVFFFKISKEMTVAVLLIFTSVELIEYILNLYSYSMIMILLNIWEIFAAFHIIKIIRNKDIKPLL
jgi:hypothetical protein